mgnify:CR=1 FL=1|tara:strand:+ start:299 stop:754 length:456 start_codon:yes stop_codon:yes gene_type:complete
MHKAGRLSKHRLALLRQFNMPRIPVQQPRSQQFLQLDNLETDGIAVWRGRFDPRTNCTALQQWDRSINALRVYLAEFGIIAPNGPVHLRQFEAAHDNPKHSLPEMVIALYRHFFDQILTLSEQMVLSDQFEPVSVYRQTPEPKPNRVGTIR